MAILHGSARVGSGKPAQGRIAPWLSKCGPWTSRINITQGFLGSWPPVGRRCPSRKDNTMGISRLRGLPNPTPPASRGDSMKETFY